MKKAIRKNTAVEKTPVYKKSSIISPEREEEIVQTWLGWLIDGTFVHRDDTRTGVTWGPNATNKNQDLHRRISTELDDRQHPVFTKAWDEVFRRYRNIPLLKALS